MTRPPVFTSLDLGTALARSESEHKLLVVDATAPWCGPCRMMDRTTWRDPDVLAWIEAHAIAFQLDVDAYSAAGKQLAVTALPTIIVFRDGDEIDRVIGFQKPGQLLVWLGGIARGVTSLDTKRGEIAVNPDDASLRFEYARMLVAAGRHDQATSEFEWLLAHRRDALPACAFELAPVLDSHAPARALLVRTRDALTPAAAPSLADLRDWLLLNDVLGEPRRSLQWYDDTKASLPAQRRDELATLIRDAIGPLLLGAHRWRDAVDVYREQLWRTPVRELVETWSMARRHLRSRR